MAQEIRGLVQRLRAATESERAKHQLFPLTQPTTPGARPNVRDVTEIDWDPHNYRFIAVTTLPVRKSRARPGASQPNDAAAEKASTSGDISTAMSKGDVEEEVGDT